MSKDADVEISRNGLTQWMSSRNMVPMPFVGSFQTVLPPGQDVRFSYEKMDASWNFINKIWNISRYILMNNEGLTLEQASANVEKKLPTKKLETSQTAGFSTTSMKRSAKLLKTLTSLSLV